MPDVNRLILVGRLAKDPEVRKVESTGRAMVTMRVVTTERFRRRDGSIRRATEYHKVVAFGGVAEAAARELRRGSPCYVEGRVETRSWEQDGRRYFGTSVIADRVTFLGEGPVTQARLDEVEGEFRARPDRAGELLAALLKRLRTEAPSEWEERPTGPDPEHVARIGTPGDGVDLG